MRGKRESPPRRRWRVTSAALLLALAAPGAALAGFTGSGPSPGWTPFGPSPGSPASEPGPRAAPNPCPTNTDGGDPIQPDHVVTGEFGTAEQGSYVMLPFNVPAGTDAVRVKYCHDQPEAPTNSQIKHVLDLGIYDARGPDGLWDSEEFRGWGGSSHPDTTVSVNGFSSEAEYLEAPRRHRRGHTTRGFLPGPMPEGEWAVELGVAAVASQQEGDGDGKVAWRVEIDVIDSPDYSDQPYAPAAYDSTPADADPGWYAGDFHVHAEHSSLGDATMTETFDYAFGPLPPATGAGLDFITLSDYVTTSAWGEIGRYQPNYPGKLIMRSAEVITYRGHANNHGSLTWADYRTGPILERNPATGALTQIRPPTAPSGIFDTVAGAGGFTQINHPTIFPSQVPGFDFMCRGCPWDYTPAETDYSKVDAIEIATGPAGTQALPTQPGPNPFTPTAIQFWEDGIDAGGQNSNKIAAVGSSDSHRAGRFSDLPSIPSAPIGQATTVVQAPELSEQGIEDGVEAGHTYVKIWGNDGPDLRLCAGDLGADGQCSEGVDPAETIMGDTLQANSTQFVGRVLNLARANAARPGAYTLMVFKDGEPILEAPMSGDQFTLPFPSLGLGRYRLQVMRLATGVASIEAVSSPIYLEAGGGPPPDDDADDDGITDPEDNCPLAANPGQDDTDGDGLGDACDADNDGDSTVDAEDRCPDFAGPASDFGCPTERSAVNGNTVVSGTAAPKCKRKRAKARGQARRKCRRARR